VRFNRLDLNLLVALDVLLSEKSITRAARQLNLSQSATSGVLARLREYFKDDLLVPVGRTLVLTPLATSLSEPVRKVLLQIQATIEIKPAFDPRTAAREFRVVASDYIASVLLGEAGRRISGCAPGVTLDISSPNAIAIEGLDRGEFDLIVMPRKFTSGAHPLQVLFEESYTCIVWDRNSAVGATLTLDEYMSAGHVSSRFSSSATSYEEWFLKASGFDRRIEIATTNFTSMPHFVIGTDRIATMHTRLAQTLARYYPIRLVAPPIEIPKLEMCMQWNSFLDHDPAHIWFRELLAQVASGDPSDAPDPGPAPAHHAPDGDYGHRETAEMAACA
jgi:DNA-binding transcriptional LysR family regulator